MGLFVVRGLVDILDGEGKSQCADASQPRRIVAGWAYIYAEKTHAA
jgi:hypothetical protein